MNTRDRCRRMIERGLSQADAARRCRVNPATVRKWAQRYRWKRDSVTPATTENAPCFVTPPMVYQWMTSLHHDQEHLVGPDGVALCNARVPLGGRWQPAFREARCRRCLGEARKQNITPA